MKENDHRAALGLCSNCISKGENPCEWFIGRSAGWGRVPIVVEKEKGVFSGYPKKQLAHGVSQTEEK